MAVLTPVAKMQFLDATGAPLVGGLLYTYAAGTTTPQASYTDSTGATANTNPVVLDARGEANIWLASATYKFKLASSDNTELWTVDNISAPTSALSPVLSGNVTIDSNSAGPALKITQTGTGPVLRVQDSVDPDVTPFIIDSTGQVGLGTQSPSTAFDVNDGVIQLSSSGVSRTTISADASNSTINSPSTRGLILSTGGTPRITVASGGGTTLSGALTVSSGGAAITGNSSVTGTLTATSFVGPWANIPAGTVMLFVQTAAPTGWTKSTAHDNKALRVVSGAASSGGSVAFTTAFASQGVSGTVGSYTLTTADIPSHTHTATVTDPGHAHTITTGSRLGDGAGADYWVAGSGITRNANSNTTGITVANSSTGGGGGHNHTFTGTAINLAVQYVDVIIATKD
jgi:hypothetical protein